jgi:hypothetical protein
MTWKIAVALIAALLMAACAFGIAEAVQGPGSCPSAVVRAHESCAPL